MPRQDADRQAPRRTPAIAAALKAGRVHLLCLCIVALVAATGLHVRLRDMVLDARFHANTRAPAADIAMVEIDPRSIAAIGRWPWPRSLHADLVRKLGEAGVTEIAFDVDFSARSTDADDRAFTDALRKAGGGVILATFRQAGETAEGKPASYVNRPLPAFESNAWQGLVNVMPDRDGAVRRFTFGATIDGVFVPSIAALLTGRHEPAAPEFRIDFGIDRQAVPGVSFIDVLRDEPAALAALRGKKVLVSGTAAELGDRFVIPNGHIIPGALLQILAAESIFQNRTLQTTAPALAFALALLPLGAALLMRRRRGSARIAAVICTAVAAEAAAAAVQIAYPVAVDTSLLLVAAAACALIILVDEVDIRGLLRQAAERRFHNVAMSLSDGLVCLDGEGRITMANEAATRIFGVAAADIKGRPFADLLAPEADAPSVPGASGLFEPGNRIVEQLGRRAGGELFPLESSWSIWETPSGRHYGVVLRDISERRRQQERIRYLAENDVVSGLPNHNRLIAALDEALRDGRRHRLMLAGLPNFDRMRDLEGQDFADALVRAAAARLRALAPDATLLSRPESDEFAVLLQGDEAAANRLAVRIIADFRSSPLEFSGRTLRMPLFLGHAGCEDAAASQLWLGNARFALAQARTHEQEAPVAFAMPMREEVEKRVALEARLRLALAAGEFELFYQPQVDLRTRAIIGAEALIRWRHPERGYVSPGEFMPVVNGTSLSEGVAAWVLETAIRQAAIWQKQGTPIRVGVNLAQSQFAAGSLVADVARLLDATGLAPGLVELEVTEDIILDDISRVRTILAALRDLGLLIAFDDFGTGYGSLTSLRDFPLDVIKIDQTFVRTLAPGTENAAIVAATIELGHALGHGLIAEGIEDEAIAALLSRMGCEEGQGYLFGRPMPARELEANWLRRAA